jgi:hypothetical protein
MIVPTPFDVAVYFARRRGGLSELTEEDLEHNEALWLQACGLDPAAAEARGERNAVPLSPNAMSHLCMCCGAAFRPQRSDARTCSPACRKRMSRRRAAA